MNQIKQKNYIILVLLLVVTVFLTLLLSNIYTNKNKKVSEFYESSNKITSKEIDEYLMENPDTIIYVSDKYDLSHESFENEFKLTLEKLNIEDKLVFIDKSELKKSDLELLKKRYKINIDITKLPVVIIVIDKEEVKNIFIDEWIDVENFIDYGVFE